MTKKDYIAIGNAIAREHTVDYGGDRENAAVDRHHEEIVNALCRVFRSDNPSFKEQRFRDFVAGKCGPNGGVR